MYSQNIVFIGCGNMGRSLLNGLINNGFQRENLIAVEIDPERAQKLREDFEINVTDNMHDVVALADIIILAVKPQIMEDTVSKMTKELTSSRPLLISIAAGISLHSLASWSAPDFAIVRAMPNTPALVNQAATAICANKNTSETQIKFANGILSAVGTVFQIQDESLIDVVTALSGSGPAYYFYFLEIMENAAISMGMEKELARKLAQQTVLGAACMARESGLEPSELRKQVTSPGGTTEAALKIMQEHELAKIISDAMNAALKRSRELSGDSKSK